jgi:hypothetical protein
MGAWGDPFRRHIGLADAWHCVRQAGNAMLMFRDRERDLGANKSTPECDWHGGAAGPKPAAVVPRSRCAIPESDGSDEFGAADDQYVRLVAIPARGEHGDFKFVLSF